MTRLAGKTALVTGAGRGVGAAIARAFAAEGAAVIVTDRDADAAEAVAHAVAGRSESLDVASETDWRRIEETTGPLDILVNNAGVTGFEAGPAPHDPEHAALEDWRTVCRVNLDGTFLGCRAAIRLMRPRGAGAILNIASRSGVVGVPQAAAYAASKAAILNHTRSVALYCAQQGLEIRCNAILPGAILTPLWEPMLGDGPDREATKAALVADTPLKRFGDPEEVAALAVFLASDAAAYVTGAEFPIDGGLTAGPSQ